MTTTYYIARGRSLAAVEAHTAQDKAALDAIKAEMALWDADEANIEDGLAGVRRVKHPYQHIPGLVKRQNGWSTPDICTAEGKAIRKRWKALRRPYWANLARRLWPDGDGWLTWVAFDTFDGLTTLSVGGDRVPPDAVRLPEGVAHLLFRIQQHEDVPGVKAALVDHMENLLYGHVPRQEPGEVEAEVEAGIILRVWAASRT